MRFTLPAMYRLKLPDGSFSDMVSLTRAKEALAALDERVRPWAGNPNHVVDRDFAERDLWNIGASVPLVGFDIGRPYHFA
jgi:hypothetical protein